MGLLGPSRVTYFRLLPELVRGVVDNSFTRYRKAFIWGGIVLEYLEDPFEKESDAEKLVANTTCIIS